MSAKYNKLKVNINSKKVIADDSKVSAHLQSLLVQCGTCEDEILKQLYVYKYRCVEEQYKKSIEDKSLGSYDYKVNRCVTIGEIVDDKYAEIVRNNLLASAHPIMYVVDFTSRLDILISCAFGIPLDVVTNGLNLLCKSHGYSLEYLSYCILANSCDEELECDIRLSEIWGLFPQIKSYLSGLCEEAESSNRGLLQCVSGSDYTTYYSNLDCDPLSEVVSAFNLKLILVAQNYIKDLIVDFNDYKDVCQGLLYNQFMLGCVFGSCTEIDVVSVFGTLRGTSIPVPIRRM